MYHRSTSQKVFGRQWPQVHEWKGSFPLPVMCRHKWCFRQNENHNCLYSILHWLLQENQVQLHCAETAKSTRAAKWTRVDLWNISIKTFLFIMSSQPQQLWNRELTCVINVQVWNPFKLIILKSLYGNTKAQHFYSNWWNKNTLAHQTLLFFILLSA